jgi:hypothetical protein
MDLRGEGVPAGDAFLLGERVRAVLSASGRYRLVSREEMDNILKEAQFQGSDLCDSTSCYAEIGGALGAQKMVAGSVGRLKDTHTLTLKLIDIQRVTDERMVARDCACEGGALLRLAEEAARALVADADPAAPPAASSPAFAVSALRAPGPMSALAPAAAAPPAGLEIGQVDVEALEAYDDALRFDEGDAPPRDKAARWRALTEKAPRFAERARARADEWQRQADWLDARDGDWQRLRRLLALRVVPDADKQRFAAEFVRAYGTTAAVNPYVDELTPWLAGDVARKVERPLALRVASAPEAYGEYQGQPWDATVLTDGQVTDHAFCSTAGATPPLRFVFTLPDGRTHRVTRVGLSNFANGYEDSHARGVEIAVSERADASDAAGFAVVARTELAAKREVQMVPLAAVAARHVAVTVTSTMAGGTWVILNEVQVWAQP